MTGISIGELSRKLTPRKVWKIKSAENIGQFEEDSSLVTRMIDPSCVPIMGLE